MYNHFFQFLLVFSLISINSSFCQTYVFNRLIGLFNRGTSITISPEGYIYVADKGADEILKYDTLGTVLKSIGGYGWNGSSFDDPADIFASSMNILVSDYNNHKIKIFDKELSLLSELYTYESLNKDEAFGYPVSCVKSNQGDVYVIDSENKRIVKFDFFNKYSTNFGGFASGNFTLTKPKSIASGADELIYVIDESELFIFDSFGNGINKIKFEEPVRKVTYSGNKIVVTGKENIYIADYKKANTTFKKVNLANSDLKDRFISAIYFKGSLYVLTPSTIQVFSSN